MSVQLLRGGFAMFSLTALSCAISAHAVLPTPTETTTPIGEVSYVADPTANPNAPTRNSTTAARVITVTPQDTPIENPLGQTGQAPSVNATPPATTTQIISTPIHQTMTATNTVNSASANNTAMVGPTQTSTPAATTPTMPTTPPANTPIPRQGSSVGIDSVVNAFIVQQINGQETLVPVNIGTPVKSGDVLEYQGLFTNRGSERVRAMDVTLTIADDLELIGGLHPRFPYASIDGNRFVRSPIRANIGGQVQELPMSQYKALRWTVEDIGLGGTVVVKYRAKVK